MLSLRQSAKHAAAVTLGVTLLGVSQYALAETILRASHQWPKDDVRAKMVRIIGEEVAKRDVDLKIRTYPGASLFKPKDQWGAMVKGQLDISAFPLDYASGRHPQFSATLMPGLVQNHERAKKLNDSEFMDAIKKIINDSGVKVLSDAWLAGGFVSKVKCIEKPEDVDGQVTRAAGPYFERMLSGAGASIAPMPSSEIYTAMQTGVLDAANTSSGSLVSYRIYEQTKCLTAPGKKALWFMYEPILMSKQSWDKLNDKQQKAVEAGGQKAEDFFLKEAKKLDQTLVKAYKKGGNKVVTMNDKQFEAWKKLADKTSYQHFRESVPGGKELLEMALSVK